MICNFFRLGIYNHNHTVLVTVNSNHPDSKNTLTFLFITVGLFSSAQFCQVTSHHKLAWTGANYPAISQITGYFGNKTKNSWDIFSTKYPANCNCGLMKRKLTG